MQTVWEHSRATGPALLVMLAIADHARENGRAWPGVQKIAKKARCSGRTVQRLLAGLVKLNELHIEAGAGPHGTNVYHVTVTPRPADTTGDTLTPDSLSSGDTAMSPGGVTQLRHQGGDTAMSPEPPVNHHSEPPVPGGGGDDLSGVTKRHPLTLAQQLLAHLNAAAGVRYPESPAALRAADSALEAVHRDLAGAKKAVARQAALLREEPKKRAWLRPGTLFDPERFRMLYAERDLPVGADKTRPAQTRQQIEAQLRVEKDRNKRAALIEMLNAHAA